MREVKWMFQKYIDQWGDVWVRIDDTVVQRVRDGNLGGWFYGENLQKINETQSTYTEKEELYTISIDN